MKTKAHSIRVISQVVVLAGLVLLIFSYQSLLDSYALATFRPSNAIGAIEGRIGLTREARAIFYRAQPQLDTKMSFNRDCQTLPHELELGCFFHGRIYVLTIDDPNLAPEMDAVATHELLHGAWARMTQAEKTALGQELERVYATITDPELKARMADYAKTEPGEETNELHSILGTEYAQLSPILESHYRRYFNDRGKIVAAHQAYQAVFISSRAKLEGELNTIRSLKAQLAAINSRLEAERAADQIDAYNALIPRQNSLVDTINQKITAYRDGVDQYNGLSKSLDSQQITDTVTNVQ